MKLNAKDLRIGNYLMYNFKNKGPQMVELCFNDFKYGLEFDIEDYKPIPLTEELLIRLGWVFNTDAKCYEKFPGGDSRLFLYKKEVNNSFDMFNYVLKAIICKDIKYLHQLQNLIYSLTNKELTLKD